MAGIKNHHKREKLICKVMWLGGRSFARMLSRFELVSTAVICVICLSCAVSGQTRYLGKQIGDFKTYAHGVKGTVYVASDKTIFIKGFEYDGQGPDAFFWGDVSENPTPSGFIIPNENGSEEVLGKYTGQNLILTVPEGKSIKDIKSLAIWCRRFAVNFGSVIIPTDDLPSEKSLGPLPTLAHGVRSDDVIIKDARIIFISNLYYDGAGPDAFFLAGNGITPHSKGIKIPDENGSLEKIRGYQGENVTLRLPEDTTVFDIEWIGLYCIRYQQNFGHVMIPQHPNVPANINDLLVEASTPRGNGTQGRYAELHDDHKYQFGDNYYGKYISDFKTNAHDVSGSVFAASEDTFYLKDFTYDGEGPDAYFWAGTSDKPSPEGFIVPDEYGTTKVLKKYFSHNIAITLPDGKKISDTKWLSVWCRKFAVNFGHIMIPSEFNAPKPVNLGPFKSFSHGVTSGDVVIKDARTIAISNLYYDGNVSDTYFLIGGDLKPHADGNKIPNENGKLELQAYNGESIEIRLPNELLIMGMRWLSVYSTSLKEDFGHVSIPEDLNVPADLQEFKALFRKEVKFDNCRDIFPGVMQVSWKLLGEEIYFQLAGHADENEYLAFGLSADNNDAAMVGADVAVAFFDAEAKQARIVDYYLSTKSQCADGYGACPDTKLRGDNNIEVLSWNRADGILIVTYKRPIEARELSLQNATLPCALCIHDRTPAFGDDQDLSYLTPTSVTSVKSVVAAIGPLNSQKEVAFHDRYYNKEPIFVRFKISPPSNDCGPLLPVTTMKVEAWPSMKISDVTTFRAQIGPTGGNKGYTAITGSQSWGIAWWINGLLIPELTVQRGTNYTFIVEGGNDNSNSASYHPLYITNNPEGGGGQFLDQVGLPNHVVYAGIVTDASQNLVPTGVGRLCEWKHKSVDKAEESETFEDYKKTLQLECKDGEPGTFVWMPDEDTPDVVYYQCFTHRNLGWKINVIDADNKVAGAMEHLSEEPNSAAITAASSAILGLIIFFIIL